MKDNLPKYYTIPQACQVLGKSPRQVWRYIRDYDPEYALRAVMVGKTAIILESDLKDFQKRIKTRPETRGAHEKKR
jgi:hypothetical protein